MRDRLIELIKTGGYAATLPNKKSVAEQVADYLLASGVIVPPCKVGTTIYMIVEKRASITREYFRFIKKTKLTYLNLERVIREYGKTVFLTKEKAKLALKGGAE